MTERVPAEVFPPGDFLREELGARGWSQVEFAEIIGRPLRTVNEIIKGKRGISPATAKELAAALGTSAEVWMNLETTYRLQNTEPAPGRIRKLARIRSHYPIRDMVKRGWLEPSGSPDILEAQILRFFAIKSLDEKPELPHAARRTGRTEAKLDPLQAAWLFRVKQLAEVVNVGDFSAKRLREAVERLRALMLAPEETRHVPRILADAGVRFVIVESFPGSKIDGVCFWLSRAQPVIGMTIRFDRIDNFWFVLRHEVEHVLQRHGQIDAIVDSELERVAGEISENQQPKEERIANAAAAEFCVPRVELDDFIARVSPAFSRRRVEEFAARLQVHPGIVAGQLRRQLGRWDLFTNLLVKVRDIVTASALTDGHGHLAPVLV